MGNKEVEKLIRQVRQWNGWRVKESANGYVIYPPDKTQAPVSVHKTPSDHRWRANVIARLRRAGGPL